MSFLSTTITSFLFTVSFFVLLHLRVALTRTFGTVYRMVVFGQMPRRIPVRSIGIVTDRIENMIESIHVLRHTHQQHHGNQSILSKDHHLVDEEKKAMKNVKWRAHLLARTISIAIPQMLNSAFLGM